MSSAEQRANALIERFDAIITDEGKNQRARLGEIEALVGELAELPLVDRSPLAKQITGKIRSPKLRERRDAVVATLMGNLEEERDF